MKIECEIPDIKRDEVIEAMAAHLLGALYECDEDEHVVIVNPVDARPGFYWHAPTFVPEPR